jgi:hypothetical protein
MNSFLRKKLLRYWNVSITKIGIILILFEPACLPVGGMPYYCIVRNPPVYPVIPKQALIYCVFVLTRNLIDLFFFAFKFV